MNIKAVSAILLSLLVSSSVYAGTQAELIDLRDKRQQNILGVQEKDQELIAKIKQNQQKFRKALLDLELARSVAKREGDANKVQDINQKIEELRKSTEAANDKARADHKKEILKLKEDGAGIKKEISDLQAKANAER